MVLNRLEKLRFIVEELELARLLATHAPDAFDARTLARHILIRAHDFIEHSRGLRKPLNLAGIDTRDFHSTKEVYATAFDEYFKVSRDRMGAHLQDFDFGRRIELWNDIEISKISYFVDGAKEIYKSLAGLSIPGYVDYVAPPELTDALLQQELLLFQRSKNDVMGVELGADPLAAARENTSAALNQTPVHSRAGQLVLVRRWISMQSALLTRLQAHPRLVRILKARLVTDIVSFCDCLVTRNVSPGAPQEMDGLDKIVTGDGQSAAAITDFVAASHFDIELQTARAVRDEIGAHLEIDDACSLASLIGKLDTYNLEQGIQFYQRAAAAFIKLCHTIIYLKLYAADGQRMYGVLAGNALAAAPFSTEASRIIQKPLAPALNDLQAYQSNLNRWLDGDENQREESRHFFWGAFLGSEVVETLDETEDLGTGSRFWTKQYRKVHALLASTLAMSHLSDADFAGILELILSCSNGDPYALAELLVRQGGRSSDFRKSLICYALGEIGSSPHASVTTFLEACRKSNHWGVRFSAILAFYKTFVKSEGLLRANNRGRTSADLAPIVDDLTASMTTEELVIGLLAFASILSGHGLNMFHRWFEADYAALQFRVEKACRSYLKGDRSKEALLSQLMNGHDYVGIALLLAVELESDPRLGLREGLLDCCCRGQIVAARHDQSALNLAMCYFMKKEHSRAQAIVQNVVDRNPEQVDTNIILAQIVADVPGQEGEAIERIAHIRRVYKLDSSHEAKLAEIEGELARRKVEAHS